MSAVAAPPGRVGIRFVIGAEWLKLRTLRSTVIVVTVTVAVGIGIGALVCQAHETRANGVDLAIVDPTFLSLSGIFLSQLVLGVLGVMTITGEYSTGLIRTSIAAVPRRLRLLGAKALVFATLCLVAGAITCFASFWIGQAILSGRGLGASLGDPTVLRAVACGPLYLVILGCFALGIGTIVRRTSGAIAVLFGILLVLPIIAAALPSPWSDEVMKYLPGGAGGAALRTGYHPNLLSPWAGLGLFAAYAAVSLALGAYLIVRRDA